MALGCEIKWIFKRPYQKQGICDAGIDGSTRCAFVLMNAVRRLSGAIAPFDIKRRKNRLFLAEKCQKENATGVAFSDRTCPCPSVNSRLRSGSKPQRGCHRSVNITGCSPRRSRRCVEDGNRAGTPDWAASRGSRALIGDAGYGWALIGSSAMAGF